MANKTNLRKRIDDEKRRMQQLWEIKKSIDEVFMEVATNLDKLLNEYDQVMREEE
jgi:hypothetical protein